MAHYDRRVLVPYLRDVCVAEMQCETVTRDLRNAASALHYYEKQEADLVDQWNQIEKMPSPEKPKLSKSPYEGFNAKWVFAIAFMLSVMILIRMIYIAKEYAMLVGGVMGLLLFGISWLLYKRIIFEFKEEKKALEQRYHKEIAMYQKIVQDNKQHRDAIQLKLSYVRQSLQSAQSRYSQLEHDLQASKSIREKLYDANIIASEYRDISCAYYLYDYFRTSRETDLDRIILTMLTHDIRSKCGILIQQNQEQIVNQRRMIALQQGPLEESRRQHRALMSELRMMERNQETIMDYQNMMAGIEATTAYFAAANFLLK